MADAINQIGRAAVERLIRLELKVRGPESLTIIVDNVTRPGLRRDEVRSAIWSMLAMGDLALTEGGKVSAK